jgi:hypothetical protein
MREEETWRTTFSPLQSEFFKIGPSGVHALPLAAGRNEGGHYLRYFGPSRVRFRFVFFRFKKNSRRRSVRVLKLHSEFIITKKGILTSQKNRSPPWPPLLKKSFVLNIFVILGFRNFRYDFWVVGRDVWRWLCRHVFQKISASIDGGLSRGSRSADKGARTLARR